MKKKLQSIVLLLVALMMPAAASAAWVQVADGVYQDGSTLCIGSGVTSLGSLQLNPSVIYCYAAIPPACTSSTFTSYGATLHVPTSSMVSYFTAQYWYNFTNVQADAIEPQAVTMNSTEVQVEIGQQFSLNATVTPSYATPSTVYWSSINTAIATVDARGTVSAVAPGECYIRAMCVDKLALCHVTVTPKPVTITLDKQEAHLLPNHLMTLTATCTPAAIDLTVTSSNDAVAIPRIVNGTIQVVGIAEGTATITVSTADGWCYPAECVITVYTELGDTNCDGYINIADATELIDYLLSGNASQINLVNGDTDQNGSVNIADVTELIDYLFNGHWSWEDPQDQHEWVDLGLPSGTLWATCNLGANSPEEYGDYFAWGETEPKDFYNWSTYKWCNGSNSTLTKYCTNSSYGAVDNKLELDPKDDAAYVNWGENWRMPTKDQLKELQTECTWTWTTQNGVNGRLMIGPNGNSLFLPAAGYRSDSSLNGAGSWGGYWSRRLYSSNPRHAYGVYFLSGDVDWSTNDRTRGFPVRAVRVPQN